MIKALVQEHFINSRKIKKYGAISIREAFFGGRTHNFYFNRECGDGEEIRYLDVTSLYPYVLVKNRYPIGHPKLIEVFSETETDITDYFGFIKCKVLPPTDLYIPVLPMRDENNKLMFPLCRQCAVDK